MSVLYLSHLLDFGASFADEGATLAGRDDQPQGHWGLTGGGTVAHRVDYILWGIGGAQRPRSSGPDAVSFRRTRSGRSV